jgi:hypothetical protein
MKSKIIMLICAPLFLTSLPIVAQTSQKTITIENYTTKPLTFLSPVDSTNSTIHLPNKVKEGTGTAFSKASGKIQIKVNLGKISGVFLIGYSDHQFCEYRYTMDANTPSSWFMYASRAVNMSGTSCPVDVNIHQIIVFQEMGKARFSKALL